MDVKLYVIDRFFVGFKDAEVFGSCCTILP